MSSAGPSNILFDEMELRLILVLPKHHVATSIKPCRAFEIRCSGPGNSNEVLHGPEAFGTDVR